jgi:hypothetical protein
MAKGKFTPFTKGSKPAGKFPAKKPGVNQDGTQARKALVPKPKKGK